jgi:hypothetical protein
MSDAAFGYGFGCRPGASSECGVGPASESLRRTNPRDSGERLALAARFPLYETAAAHKEVERGGKIGTVIVEPQR